MGFFSKKTYQVEQQPMKPAEPEQTQTPTLTSTPTPTYNSGLPPRPENMQPAETSRVEDERSEEKHSENHDNHDDYVDDNDDVEPAQEWDEGGPSHCGYHSTVHETLMLVGSAVHSVVGDPPEMMDSSMKQVGNWFQEASYAVRDFWRGDKAVGADAADAFSSMHQDVAGLIGSPNEGGTTAESSHSNNNTASPSLGSA